MGRTPIRFTAKIAKERKEGDRAFRVLRDLGAEWIEIEPDFNTEGAENAEDGNLRAET